MFEKHGLSWTLKIHVILDHYSFYFKKTNKTLRHTSGEFPESAHSTLKKSEQTHGFKITKSIGSPIHQQSSLSSLTFINSKNIGYVAPIKMRKTSQRSSPKSSRSPLAGSSPYSSHSPLSPLTRPKKQARFKKNTLLSVILNQYRNMKINLIEKFFIVVFFIMSHVHCPSYPSHKNIYTKIGADRNTKLRCMLS